MAGTKAKKDHWTRAAYIVSLCLLGVLLLLPDSLAMAQSPNRVALVIQFNDETVWMQCVEFTEPEMTGIDVLLRSGLNVVYSGGSGTGALVCKIGDRGCDNPSRCLCQCKGANCAYWSYWHLVDGAWQYSNLGASDYTVKPGAVEGWVWGEGSISNAPQPPSIQFEDVCQALTPTPPPAGTSTPTPALLAAPPSPTALQAYFTPFATATATQAVAMRAVTAMPSVTPSATLSSTSLADRPQPSGYAYFLGIVALLAAAGVMVWHRGKSRA